MFMGRQYNTKNSGFWNQVLDLALPSYENLASNGTLSDKSIYFCRVTVRMKLMVYKPCDTVFNLHSKINAGEGAH